MAKTQRYTLEEEKRLVRGYLRDGGLTMPVHAALTQGDPPQMEFIPRASNETHPKLTGRVIVFKFPSMALLIEAKKLALTRQFGLWRVTKRDMRTSHEPAKECKDIEEFQQSLDITGWCDRCQNFTYGVRANGRCKTCRKPTQ